jgi:hypothetical protein
VTLTNGPPFPQVQVGFSLGGLSLQNFGVPSEPGVTFDGIHQLSSLLVDGGGAFSDVVLNSTGNFANLDQMASVTAPTSGQSTNDFICFASSPPCFLLGGEASFVGQVLGQPGEQIEVNLTHFELDGAQTSSTAPPGNAVAEPATLALLSGSLIGLVFTRRRRTPFLDASRIAPREPSDPLAGR